MRIVGHGIDIVSVHRIASMLDEQGERFLDRCFTSIEQAHGRGSRRYAEHLAGRFAAKEATLKALGTGWTSGIGWAEIGITTDASGKPSLTVSGKAALAASRLGIDSWMVSLSHTEEFAVASVIAINTLRHGD